MPVATSSRSRNHDLATRPTTRGRRNTAKRRRVTGSGRNDGKAHECFRCGQPGHWSNAWCVKMSN